MDTTILRCPACGSNLRFDATIQRWRCESCFNIYAQEDVYKITYDSDLALEDVAADDKKIGASGLIMAILGGAVITPVQGLISDAAGIHISYIVPLVCLVIVLAYAWAVETGKFNEAAKA